MRGGTAAKVATGVLFTAVGAGLGVLGAFLVPLRLVGVPGVAVVLAVTGNVLAGVLAGWAYGSPRGAAWPAAGWLLAVAVLAGWTRGNGGLVVPGVVLTIRHDAGVDDTGTLFVLGGLLAAVVGYALAVRAQPPRRASPRPR